jgi:hypothetical protein
MGSMILRPRDIRNRGKSCQTKIEEKKMEGTRTRKTKPGERKNVK